MRVNPILTWDYTDIWGFLRKLYVPYCILYDRGYSSIGPKSKTFPNPDLVSKDAAGKVIVKPAYTLVNNELERSGRNWPLTVFILLLSLPFCLLFKNCVIGNENRICFLCRMLSRVGARLSTRSFSKYIADNYGKNVHRLANRPTVEVSVFEIFAATVGTLLILGDVSTFH